MEGCMSNSQSKDIYSENEQIQLARVIYSLSHNIVKNYYNFNKGI